MTSGDRIRVLLADDHRILREALRAVLASEFDVLGEAATGEAAANLAVKLKPDVLVLDLRMSGMDGFAAARRIGKEVPNCKVLILSQYEDQDSVIEALVDAGAAGFVVKSDAASDLITAIRAVHSGRLYVSASIAPIVLARLKAPKAEADAGLATLTRREREMLRLIGEGATSKDAARRLGIAPKTAQIHRENLKRKLNLRTTAAIVRYAIEHKLVRID
ncbi:MAG TPA: response regulator transcription factor [Candidatus Binataceae bacterium]|nr:response regulator transcription factor [Candidatus Binataceae bacterium]